MHLTWLRSDLRIDDNTALSAATERGPTIALWLVSPGQWRAHDDADCKVDFWLRNLRDLRQALEKLNIPLLIRKIDTWDQAPQAVLDVCQQHQVQSVHWNEEYGINEQRRDAATRKLLEKASVQAHSYLDQLLFRPGTILTRSGDYFQVFSQFKKTCLEHLHRSLPALARRVKRQAALKIHSDPIPQHIDGFEKPRAPCVSTGRRARPMHSSACRSFWTKPSTITLKPGICRQCRGPASFRLIWPPG